MPRLILASASSFSHLPSCTTKLTIHHWAINSLRRKEWGSQRLLETVDRDLECVAGYCTWALSFDCLSDVMADDLQTSQVPPTKTSWTTWRTSSEYCASLRSSTSFENQSRLKQSKRKKIQTSSIVFSGQKLRSRTSATLSLILNGAVSAALILPSSSFGLFGMQVQHQTSTHAGNILSSYGNPCKLNPCPSVCYLHALTKEQGKGKWALPKKNIAMAFEDYLAKEGCLEDPFSKQILRNYQPCASTP